MITEFSELALVNLAKQKDGDAICELVRRYQPMISTMKGKYFYRDFTAADWNQEALIICFESACLFDETKSNKFGYFFKLRLANHAKTMLRYESAEKRRGQLDSTSLDLKMEITSEDNMDDELIYEDNTGSILTKTILFSFIESLTYLEIMAFRTILGEMSNIETIRIVGCTKKQLQSAKDRCKRKYRKIVMSD